MAFGNNISRSSTEASFVKPTVDKHFFVYPDVLRFHGSVIPLVTMPVLCMTLFSYLIACLDIYYGVHLAIPNTIVPSLSVVVGLLLVFRTNTAYDRYYEGRRIWTTMKSATRNLARAIYMVPASSQEDLDEKRVALNLAVAYNFATKLYLRDELEEKHHELDHLLVNSLLSRHFRFSGENLQSESSLFPGLKRVMDFDRSTESAPLNRQFNHVYQSGYGSTSSASGLAIDVNDDVLPVNLPVEIIYNINKYVFKQRQANIIDPQTNNNMNGFLASLTDSLGGLERIMRTPIPLAYLIHLKQAVTIYLIFLPFTLIDLGFMMVPLVAVVSFTLYGIDAIGQEIENPFGYDANDLPLDAFCNEIQEELRSVILKLDIDPKFSPKS